MIKPGTIVEIDHSYTDDYEFVGRRATVVEPGECQEDGEATLRFEGDPEDYYIRKIHLIVIS